MNCLLAMSRFALYLAALLLSAPLAAEIEQVVVRWEGRTCLESCQASLLRQFGRLQGVAEVEMGNGEATLRWKPRRPFSFQAVNQAIRNVGVTFQGVWVTVRGTVQVHRDKVELHSLGDETLFILLSPLAIEQDRAVTPQSIFSYIVEPATAEKLSYNEKTYRMVTVKGRLFQPHRSPPNYLIIESLVL